ncbi:MAG TPA: hypothetical protein VI032_10425 [Burkholderiaceae bacterium]
MNPTSMRLGLVALLFAASATPGLAESLASSAASAGSSASSAGSASSGSVSDSFANSSKSSTGTQTADGDYRVIEVAELADRPDMLQLTLQATAAANGARELTLRLPRRALEPRGITAGDIVNVRNRDYGVQFARTDGRAAQVPFFLVLFDDWQRELEPRPVTL